MNDHDPGSTPDDTGPESSTPEDPGTADAIPTVYTDAQDVAAILELAEAERATARRGASPAQAEGLRVVGDARRTEDRVARWRSTRRPGDRGPR